MKKIRITIKDIAAKSGFSSSTVSYALRNHPSIPEKTRDKIRAIAEKMGYQPDPMLSALVAYRRQKQIKETNRNVLALLTGAPFLDWIKEGKNSHLYAGLEDTAFRSGYDVEKFTCPPTKKEQRQLGKTLYNRGIKGLVCLLWPNLEEEVAFPWHCFSVVSMSRTPEKPTTHSVVTNLYQSMILIAEKLKELGYERPALVISEGINIRTCKKWEAGYRLIYHDFKKCPKPLIFEHVKGLEDGSTMALFQQWLKKEKPDVLIHAGPPYLLYNLKNDLKMKVPEEIGYCSLDHYGDDPIASGILQSRIKEGSLTVELLTGMILRGETGKPDIPYCLELEGIWIPGKSLVTQV